MPSINEALLEKPPYIVAAHPPKMPKNIEKIMTMGSKVIAISLGNTKKFTELIPMTSKASICSVTRMVPILDVI